jgi:cobalt/nickel transport system permease protein
MFAVLGLLELLIAILSKIGIKRIIIRTFLVIPFILASLPLIFSVSGEPLFSFQILNSKFIVSMEGLLRFESILIKSWFSILMSVLLVMTTTFSEILKSLRWLHVPRLLVVVIGLMWRYLFVIGEEAKRLLTARGSRSGRIANKKSGGNLFWRAKTSGGLAGNLFLRSLDRSERVYYAMVSRGYDGEIKLMKNRDLFQFDYIILVSGLIFLILVIVYSKF